MWSLPADLELWGGERKIHQPIRENNCCTIIVRVGVSGQRTGDTSLVAVRELQRTMIEEKRKTIA